MQTKFGQRAKDVITGFSGTITGKASYITGCNQSLLSGTVKADGDLTAGQWFDDDRLQIVDESVIELPNTADGPDATPSRSQSWC